jgi:hypothetical protein
MATGAPSPKHDPTPCGKSFCGIMPGCQGGDRRTCGNAMAVRPDRS